MTRLTFVQPDGSRLTLDATNQPTVMHVAIRHDVPGLPAECGGQLACATCMVDVDPASVALVPPAGLDERDMLEDRLGVARPHLRLCCQIAVTAALDGLVLHIPEQQGPNGRADGAGRVDIDQSG